MTSRHRNAVGLAGDPISDRTCSSQVLTTIDLACRPLTVELFVYNHRGRADAFPGLNHTLGVSKRHQAIWVAGLAHLTNRSRAGQLSAVVPERGIK